MPEMPSVLVRAYLNRFHVSVTCHSGRDGECQWEFCPQVRDKEPFHSGRHCPLDCDCCYEDGNLCPRCEALTHIPVRALLSPSPRPARREDQEEQDE